MALYTSVMDSMQNGSAPNVISYHIVVDDTMCHLAEHEGITGIPRSIQGDSNSSSK